MPEQNNENEYFTILKTHLENLKGSPKLKDVVEYLGLGNLKALKKEFPSPKSKEIQKPFSLKLIRQLHLGFQLPYKKFLLSKNELDEFYAWHEETKSKIKLKLRFTAEAQMLTKWSAKSGDIIDFYHIGYSTRMKLQEKRDFLEEYPNILKKHFEKVDNCLSIYEYLGKGNKKTPDFLKIYGEGHESIFSTIESVIDRVDDISYCRYIALPYRHKYHVADNIFEKYTQEALLICSVSLFKHICRCIYKYAKDSTRSVKFYIVSDPWRPYHIGLINNKNEERYIFSEYFRYSEDGGLLPDILFIENVKSDHTEILYDTYQTEMEAFLNKDRNQRNYLSSIDQIKDIMQNVNDNIEKEKDEETRKKLMVTIKKKLDFLSSFS